MKSVWINLALLVSAAALAAAPQSAAGSEMALPSQSLGLFVYPREGQPLEAQAQDEVQCLAWARGQTGIDPLAAFSGTPARAGTSTSGSGGGETANAAVSGAARGAVAGTAVGAAAGDTGKGAAIGATAGLLKRAREARTAAKESEARAAAEGAAQAQAAAQQRRQTFDRAFEACLDGRGYTVR